MTKATHVTVLDNSHDSVVGVRLQGKLDQDALRSLAEALRPVGAAPAHPRVLLELKSVNNFTADELWQAMIAESPQLHDVERLAVICDDYDYRTWFTSLSEAQFHGRIRSFAPADLRSAWHWMEQE